MRSDSPPPSYYEAPDPIEEDEEVTIQWCSECGRPKLVNPVFVSCTCPPGEADDDLPAAFPEQAFIPR